MGEGRGRDLGLFQPLKPVTEPTPPDAGEVEAEGKSLWSILGGDDEQAAAEDWPWASRVELWRFWDWLRENVSIPAVVWNRDSLFTTLLEVCVLTVISPTCTCTCIIHVKYYYDYCTHAWKFYLQQLTQGKICAYMYMLYTMYSRGQVWLRGCSPLLLPPNLRHPSLYFVFRNSNYMYAPLISVFHYYALSPKYRCIGGWIVSVW